MQRSVTELLRLSDCRLSTTVCSTFKPTMISEMTVLLRIAVVLWSVVKASSEENNKEIEDICLFETFQPRCLKNEVILMKSATYGRMRIGRCVTAAEISDLQRANLEETTQYLGCSADVLPILDRKCSGSKECEVRLSEISAEDIKPCLSGLVVYLEVSYSCISVVDEQRSCTVSVSNSPVHIIGLSGSQRLCGTTSQPWIVEAPVGQRINIVLLNFATASPTRQFGDHGEQSCNTHGIILDKAGKRNVSICGDNVQREMNIYSSDGNTVYIIFNLPDQPKSDYATKFVLKLEAIGCSDIIPPEDAWLKRNNDAILIGCYSSRQTWHLNCQDGKWVGVLGNCSLSDHGIVNLDSQNADEKSETDSKFASTELVLAIVAIIGFTVAICIAVICIGAICLRQVNKKSKKREEYKTLNYQINSIRSQQSNMRISSDAAADFLGKDLHVLGAQQMPLYSVYAGDKDVNVIDNNARANQSSER